MESAKGPPPKLRSSPIQYIHYRGGAPVMADLVTGRVDFSLASFNSARSNMDAKKLRALAVDAETRLPALPDIPTLIEAGLGAHRVADWAGVMAPAGKPHSHGKELGLHCSSILSIGQRGGRCSERCPPGLSSEHHL